MKGGKSSSGQVINIPKVGSAKNIDERKRVKKKKEGQKDIHSLAIFYENKRDKKTEINFCTVLSCDKSRSESHNSPDSN